MNTGAQAEVRAWNVFIGIKSYILEAIGVFVHAVVFVYRLQKLVALFLSVVK